MKIVARNDGLTEAEMIRAMSAAAFASGFAPELVDALEKSGQREDRPPERYLLDITESLGNTYDKAVGLLGQNIGRWFAAQFRERRAWIIAKALPNQQLTPQQVEELKMLIEAHFQPAFVPAVQGVVGFGPVAIRDQPPIWGIPPDVWARWQDQGIVVQGMQVPEIANAYTAGRLYQVISEGTTFHQMLALAASVPLTRPQQLGIAWAEQHAAQYITKFGQQLAQKATGMVLNQNQKMARILVTRYLEGGLKTTPATKVPPHNLSPEERATLETTDAVASWKALASEMFKTFKGTDEKRDWMRVAASETRLAMNAGRLEKMEEQGVAHVYFLVRPTACPHCMKIYLHPDGSPRIFPIKELAANVMKTGGVNVGRKASLIGKPGGWIATLLLHPFCRCLPMPYTGHAPFGPAKGAS